MADAVETIILKALVARLEALTLTPALPIAWQNGDFTPSDGNYLRAFILWNRNINRGVAHNSKTEFRGIFQVNVVAAIRTGLVAPTNIAGAIADHFERETLMAGDVFTVRIEGRPSLAPAVGGPPDRTVFPVSANYYAFA